MEDPVCLDTVESSSSTFLVRRRLSLVLLYLSLHDLCQPALLESKVLEISLPLSKQLILIETSQVLF